MGFDENDSFYEDNMNTEPERREPTPMGNRHTPSESGLKSFLMGAVLLALLLVATSGVTRLIRQAGWLPDTVRTRIAQPATEQAVQEPLAQTETVVPELPKAAVSVPPAAQDGMTQLRVESTPAGTETLLTDDPKALSLQEIYERTIGSVVSIVTTKRSGSASGTGILMSADGYVITNHHVISDATSVSVLTSDDQLLEAQLVGSDETSDLAVLKVEGTFTPAQFGDSGMLRVGDTVVAIGDPLGVSLRGTMTNGIISAINRDLTVGDRTMTLIQTNAALNNGNSGGPLINCYGQVIGINTIKMSSYYSSASVEGLGFAIPVAVAKPIIDELIENGYVAGRPAIGIMSESLPDAFRIYYRLPRGIYISGVTEGSDAQAKGIGEGDIITAINGTPVTTNEELNTVKNQFSAGDTVTLTIFRGGKYYDVEVELIDQVDVK